MRSEIQKRLLSGGDTPLVCVSLTGRSEEEILAQAEGASLSEADMAEWRADLYCGLFSPEGKALFSGTEEDKEKLSEMLLKIRKHLGEKGLLLTVRTKKEGGEADCLPDIYAGIIEAAAEVKTADGKPAADAADIELSSGGILEKVLPCLAESGIVSVLSCHDFQKTPSADEIEETVRKMDSAGADVMKMAFMPEKEEDVDRIYYIADIIKNGLAERPYILISMGSLGERTRTDKVLGSILTFGALSDEQASAPGQISVSELRAAIGSAD